MHYPITQFYANRTMAWYKIGAVKIKDWFYKKKSFFNEVIPVQLININYGNKIAVEQYAVMLERQDRNDCFSINLKISHSTFFNYRQHSTESHLGSHIRLAVRYLN